jgi:hypothetical protein
MKVQVINDEIRAFGPQLVGENIFDAPSDYSPERYNYIPAVAGVFDPNGFVLRNVITIDFERRQSNINQMNAYMDSLRVEGLITQANFDLFLADTATNVQQYLGGGGRLITWVETVNRNGYNAATIGFKTRTAYRGALVNSVYPRAEMILSILNNL